MRFTPFLFLSATAALAGSAAWGQTEARQIEYGFVTGNQSMAGIAESLANYHTYFGDANLINTEIERYLAITPEDIRAAAQKYYVPEQRVTLYFLHDPNSQP